MSWPSNARKWSLAEIHEDAQHAKELFRKRRLGEPMADYLEAFAALERANKKLTAKLPELLSDPVDPVLVASFVKDDDLLMALRYLGAPPISADDLETLSGANLAWTQIQASPQKAASIRDVILAILDPTRYPWVKKKRKPTKIEIEKAVLAATVTASSQRVQTKRRSDERIELQGAVTSLLVKLGFEKISTPRTGIKNLRANAPKAGEFMTETLIGEHNADVVIGLHDERILALECKASNSEINSRKRINKEVAQDARDWVARFGSDNLIPAAAIQGVFKPRYIEQAQETPVVFFWGHRLSDLSDLIATVKS